VLGTDEYAAAEIVVPLLLLGYLFYGIYFNIDNGVVLRNRTGIYPVVTGNAAACALLLNAWLVPRHGLVGAAIATAASYPVLVVLMYAASVRSRRIPYDFGRTAAPIGLAIGIFAAVTLAPPSARGAVRLAGIAAYPVLLYLVGFFREPERRMLRRLFVRA
jgi:O-antigen/teichoic acid export membrane protein